MQISMFISIFCATFTLALPAQEGLYRNSHGLEGIGERAFSGTSQPEDMAQVRNWAGLAMYAPGTDRFLSVSGEFIVPVTSPPKSAAPGEYSSSIWVGINSLGTNGVPKSILQAGIYANAHQSSDGSHSPVYGAWYEWFPAGSIGIPSSLFSVGAGDGIKVSIVKSSLTTGSIELTNLRTNQVFKKDMSVPNNSPDTLDGTEVDWIVEDPSSGGFVPFPNFGTVKFTNLECWATGHAPSLNNSRTFFMRLSHTQSLAKTVVDGNANTVEITYDGP